MIGVVTGLLLLPVTGPLRAFRFFLERLHDEAEAVLRDEGRAFAELIDLSMRHNAGQLSDAEYEEQEAQLLERLNAVREYRNELLNAAQEEDEEYWNDVTHPADEEWNDAAYPDDQDWLEATYPDTDEDEREW